MDPIYLSIRLKETGDRIKNLIKARGYTVRDVQGAMGFENPQAIYKWMAGRTLPSLDNLIILSRILHTKMEDILVIDGDVVFYVTGELSPCHKSIRFRPLRGHLMGSQGSVPSGDTL
ncbi:MAG: helix-turn-helix transcriptional regulator [Lachnospiraceae bacterium]|nr:helix-turn-helix transcriptional regulator [Lachnospiraceae bacterium]